MQTHYRTSCGLVVSMAFLGFILAAGSVQAIGLEKIIELAKKRDAQVRADVYVAEARNADGWQGVGEYGPTVSTSGTYMGSRDSSQPDESAELKDRLAKFNEGDVTVALRQPLIDVSKASIAFKGMNERQMATLEIKKANEELLLRVHDRYYAVLSAQETHRLAESESAALRQQWDREKEKLELGYSTITDQQNAEARYSMSLAAEISSKATLDDRQKALEEIIDQELVEAIDDAIDAEILLPQLTGDLPYWLDLAMRNNTDLALKKLQIESARLSRLALQGRFLPALVFFADYSEQHPTGGLLEYGEDRSELDVGIRLEISLLAGGKDYAATVAAGKREKAAREQAEVARRSTQRSVRSLWDNISSTTQLIEAYKRATEANKNAMESTQASYDEGAKLLLDVLNAQQDYFRSLKAYRTSRYDYMVLLVKFRQVVGLEGVF